MRPKIRISLDFGYQHSNDNVEKTFEISHHYLMEIMSPLDLPSDNADVFAKMLCTPSDIRRNIVKKREDFTKEISKMVSQMFMEKLTERDTVMGYKKDRL